MVESDQVRGIGCEDGLLVDIFTKTQRLVRVPAVNGAAATLQQNPSKECKLSIMDCKG